MHVYNDIVGVYELPCPCSPVYAEPANHFGGFGSVRYTRKDRWSEITTDVVRGKDSAPRTLLILGMHNSEEPRHFACATMELDQARELRALLDRAIAAAELPALPIVAHAAPPSSAAA
jgi:hypothetical protein